MQLEVPFALDGTLPKEVTLTLAPLALQLQMALICLFSA